MTRNKLRWIPTLTQFTFTIVGCLSLVFLVRWEISLETLLFGLVFMIPFLGLICVRNWDPAAWDRFHDPVAYAQREQITDLRARKDELYVALQNLTTAVNTKAEPAIIEQYIGEARMVLYSQYGEDANDNG